jgi:hypothetical protein
VITRRTFVGLTGVCFTSEALVLEAVAAERMPHRIFVRGIKRAPFFELRDYEDPRVAGILERRGIRVALQEDGRLLIPFETLEAREKAWREVGAVSAPVREIAVYRSL